MISGEMLQIRVINYAKEFSENYFLGSYVSFALLNMEESEVSDLEPQITQNSSWGITQIIFYGYF